MPQVLSVGRPRLLAWTEVVKILGKVISSSHEVPRGADVSLRVAVPDRWLNEGRTIEVELPRNLTCARCGGGGCSACNQSGAITLRGKSELPEVVQVVLPLQRSTETSGRAPDRQPKSTRPVVIRIPECGGLPDTINGAIVRGRLLLEVAIEGEPSPNVRWLDHDDPLSSAKMLRAEIRQDEKPVVGDTFKAAGTSRSSRAPERADEDGEPPSSRVERVRSTDRALPATAHMGAIIPKICFGIVVLALLGILALIFW